MRLSRLRSGETVALGGAVALAVLLGLDWFFLSTPDARVGQHESGIRSLGWFAEVLLILAILGAVALAFFTVTQRATAVPITLAVFTTLFGALAVLTIAVRLVAQPGLGVDAGNADVEVELPAYLGLAAAAAIVAGAWRAVGDERIDAAESLEQTEEVLRVRGAPRPAPPPTIDRA
ncbi:MAG TPA: hypothetical protein VGW75_00725 [Solirubrobacteraceae bacterium]|nr:hypothetical protein [Solirubrobacteraceae bacterium]